MKKHLFILLISVLFGSAIIAQNNNIDPAMLKTGWSFVSPLILPKIKDTLTKEIIIKTIPKIIEQDAKGATFEIADAIYRIKKVKVLNKAFLAFMEKKINEGIKTINKQDYATTINILADIVTVSDEYLKKGILNIPDSNTTVSPNSVNTDLVSTKDVNNKIYISKKNNYLFFIPNGNYSKTDTIKANGANIVENFIISLEIGKKYDLSVDQTFSSTVKNLSVDDFQTNKEASDQFKNSILGSLSIGLGEGQIIKSEITNCPNFKALKYTYLYANKTTMESTMACIYIAFQDTTMYVITFNTLASDFLETSKSFEKLLKTFFIIGVDEISNTKNPVTNLKSTETKPIAESNKTGSLTIVNKSVNPYIIYKNGNYLTTINGKEIRENINLDIGTTTIKAEQKSGYLAYPTVNRRTVIISTTGQKATINIGFED